MQRDIFEIDAHTVSTIHELGNHMPGGFFIYKAEQPEEILYVNKPVFDLYGCDNLADFKELTGYTFRGMVHPEDYQRISESIAEQTRASDEHMDYAEYRIIRKDGSVRWVDDYGHYLETDAYGGIFTVFISDITKKRERFVSELEGHKATIDTLNETVDRMNAERFTFNRVAQALAVDYFSIYVVDPDTERFVEYSGTSEYHGLGIEKSGEDFFNLSRQNMERLIYPEDRDRFMEVFTLERVMKIIGQTGHFTTKYRLVLDSGPTYVSMKATLMEDEHGRRLIIGVNKIDAQMKREEEFRRRVAEAKTSARNDFLANMSHDIRTPLNAIIGYTNIAKENPEAVAHALERIGSSSHFLLSLINDILDLSKIENGKMEVSPAPCDLEALFGRIEDITMLQAQDKALTIVYNHEGIRHYKVMADELRIEQVLINIISNAIKYTPSGGNVYLCAEEEVLPPDSVPSEGTFLEGNNIEGEEGYNLYRFIVKDDGIGISPDYLPHIFESFTRGERTTVNRVQGTGLGLAITARVVELMGGRISVDSTLGKGSTFTVEIKLKALEEFSEEDCTGESAHDLTGHRVLLMEDNPINAEIAKMCLEGFGLAVDHAQDGEAGVAKLREDTGYSAILMDIQMPVMDGYQATRKIREMEGAYFKRVPIIAMSANVYDEDVKACLDAGMDGHIGKPFDPEKLREVLGRFIFARG